MDVEEAIPMSQLRSSSMQPSQADPPSSTKKLSEKKPTRRSERIAKMQAKKIAGAATASLADEYMIPGDLDYTLLWDEFDLNNGGYSENQGPNQVAQDEEGEPIWHTMPAGLEALSYAPHSYSAAKSKNDPDTLTWDQAMRHPWRQQFLESAQTEIQELEKHGTWIEIPRSKATDQIIPTTWVFRIKRKPECRYIQFETAICRELNQRFNFFLVFR